MYLYSTYVKFWKIPPALHVSTVYHHCIDKLLSREGEVLLIQLLMSCLNRATQQQLLCLNIIRFPVSTRLHKPQCLHRLLSGATNKDDQRMNSEQMILLLHYFKVKCLEERIIEEKKR